MRGLNLVVGDMDHCEWEDGDGDQGEYEYCDGDM